MEEAPARATDEVEVRRIFLVRHGQALERELWPHPDEHRPLTDLGYRQADGIRGALARSGIDHVVSSRAYRCVDTVWPLARAAGLRVALSDALFEGSTAADTLMLMRRTRGDRIALCTHGDVMQDVLERLDAEGIRLQGGMRFAKGAWWAFDLDDGRIRRASYHPPRTR